MGLMPCLLLLLSLCGLRVRAQQGGSSNEETLTGFTCEGNTLTITCQPGHLIKILRANYGRFNRAVCNDGSDTTQWDMQCMSVRSLKVVSQICHERPQCSVVASNQLFTDPCSTTFKYLEVEYQCVGEGVLVCLNSCENKPECYVPAHNSYFGDPCDTTPKYLEVQYKCVNPEIPQRTYPARPTLPTTTTESTTTPSTTTPSTSTTTTTKSSTTEATTTTTSTTTTITTTTTTAPPLVLYCEPVERRNIKWPRTLAGTKAFMPCPDNKDAMASWICGEDGTWFPKPGLQYCVSQDTLQVKEKVKRSEPVEQIVPQVLEVTEHDLYGGDLTEITAMMEDIVNQVDTEIHDLQDPIAKQRKTATINKDLVKATSNMLAKDKEDSWKDLPQATQSETATKLISNMEKSAFQVADALDEPLSAPIVHVEVNIVVEVNVVDPKSNYISDVVFPPPQARELSWVQGDSITIPGNTIRHCKGRGYTRIVFMSYNNLHTYISPGGYQEVSFAPSPEPSSTMDPIERERLERLGPGDHHPSVLEHDISEIEVKGREFDVYLPDENDKNMENSPEYKKKDNGKDKPENESGKTKKIVNSNIISASINSREEPVHDLPEPIYYTLEHKTIDNVYNPSCSFWEYSTKTLDGRWSDFGCEVVDTNVTHTTCSCNHLTNFAVLMDVKGVELSDMNSFALSFLTYLGCIISLVCLLLAWLTFQFGRSLQCDRNTIHKNLVLCLFLAELIFLLGIAQYQRPILCAVVAGLLHYFFLAAFAWMCLEGIQLYVMLIEVFEAEKSRRKYYYLAGYGLPLLVVIISAAVNSKGYGRERYCWLNQERGFIYAFVGPVIAVIAVNLVMLSIAIYMMCKHAAIAAELKMQEKSRTEKIRSWLKGALVLIVLLGLTWIFGLFYVSSHTILMAYLFTIFNSLQGLFIFIFHCVMNEKVRKEYKRWVRHATWLPECCRVNFGGAKAYSSSTPQTSSSGGNYLQKLWSGRKRKRSSVSSVARSTSTPLTKLVPGQYHDMREDLRLGMPNESLLQSQTEDPNEYMEPVKICIDEHCEVHGGINGDLSMIDASVVDSEAVTEYCQKNLSPIDVDKYILKNPKNRLSGISSISGKGEISESELSDGELFRLTEKERMLSEYEQQPLHPRTDSEQNLLNSTAHNKDTLPKKRCTGSTSGSDSPSLNDLNKDLSDSDNSKESLTLSTPNIKYKSGTAEGKQGPQSPSDSLLDKDSACQRSMPNLSDGCEATEEDAIEKVKKAISTNDGIITISHGKKDIRRLSSDSRKAMNAQGYRPTSSDC